MNFLKNNRRIGFLYGGKRFDELDMQCNVSESGNELVSEYILSDGLKITNVAKKYDEFDCYEWVTYYENTSDKESDIISELWDCDIEVELKGDQKYEWSAYIPDKEKATKIFSPSGSNWSGDEFYCDEDEYENNRYANHIYIDGEKEYKNVGGRSSQGKAPFFNVHTNDGGVIFAIGWSGQWNCKIKRSKDSINIKTKIEDTHFRLMPKEKIRTSSVVVMSYEGDFLCGQNKWRRLVKKHFSLIGKEGRPNELPFCLGLWGGMSDKGMTDRINASQKANMPYEYVWVDAGWYGTSDKESPDEFVGDWSLFTGNWRMNENIHKNGMKDIRQLIDDAGMKFLLWIEPERIRRNAPVAQTHPEYLLNDFDDTMNYLLNLGDEKAWQYCYNTLTSLIRETRMDCLRIDFNFNPLGYWRRADTYDRQGITEIKYVMGLYRLWDEILNEFPNIIIDNCASGGRRIDIETMRRSVPLWRSDVQCPANHIPEMAQKHNIGFGLWMPYSGTGSGRIKTAYRFRSAYAGGMTTNYLYSERDDVCSEEELAWIKRYGEEYLKVREYIYNDIYPLTEPGNDESWEAIQYNRPENGDGVVQVFKRAKSPYSVADFKLRGLDENKMYIFTDADDGSTFEVRGEVLMNKGLRQEIGGVEVAKVYFYKEA